MSDKELIEIYKGTGTGTGTPDPFGTGNGNINDTPADETEVGESGQALRRLAVSGLLVAVVAIGQFVETITPSLAHIITNALPNIPFVTPQVVAGVILGIAAWLQKRGADKHKAAVVKALITEPSQDLKAAYVEVKKGK